MLMQFLLFIALNLVSSGQHKGFRFPVLFTLFLTLYFSAVSDSQKSYFAPNLLTLSLHPQIGSKSEENSAVLH